MYKATQLSACVASARWCAGERSRSGGVRSVARRALTLLNTPLVSDCRFGVSAVNYPDPDLLQQKEYKGYKCISGALGGIIYVFVLKHNSFFSSLIFL